MGWPESRFELCRPGFSLYGGNPFRGTAWEERGAGLEPVMEVSAPLLQVRHLKPGEGISYGQTFIAPREMSVAVVGAGYATGYPAAPPAASMCWSTAAVRPRWAASAWACS